MARGVARCRDHIERADPITVVDGAVWRGLGARIAAAELVARLVGIKAHVLGKQPGVAGRDDHLGLGKPLLQGVERADMVGVGVREEDADDRRASSLGGRDDLACRAPDHRVDQGQAVALAYEVSVHKPKPADSIRIRHDLSG